MSNIKRYAAGASFFYQTGDVPYETQEVRAYGLLLHDLVSRLKQSESDAKADWHKVEVLKEVVQSCTDGGAVASGRPSFSIVLDQIATIDNS